MSLLDFFSNSNYRDSILNPNYSKPSKTKPLTEEQKKRKDIKFFKSYHLNKMKDEVYLLESEIIYGFINIKDINKINFTKFLKNRNAENWVINQLWKEFKLKHNII